MTSGVLHVRYTVTLQLRTISGEIFLFIMDIQYNLNGSNPDGSFTVDDSNLVFSPYKILRIAHENKYLGICFLILSWNCMLCVIIRIASPRRF